MHPGGVDAAGLNLSGHFAEGRLFQASRRLAERGGNGRTVADIALEVGFSDTSCFNRCFQRRFSAWPGDLRAVFATSRSQA
ncbi:helix-turn-helix domain-containing protein [Asticcacaulis sp. AC402]|uniref:helix-turn-helix domain-containing protein n=1 Tax=Asticcacaulis sp. AC402 TaxID=1282361 RepID=UPI0009E4FE68